jgi:hypothetical protein
LSLVQIVPREGDYRPNRDGGMEIMSGRCWRSVSGYPVKKWETNDTATVTGRAVVVVEKLA